MAKPGEAAMTLEFHFDFGSPNAYLAHCVLPSIEARTGAVFAYVPVLIGGVFKLTNNRSPAESLAGIKNKREYEHLEMARFIKRHGIEYNFNPHFPVNTLAIMRGAVAAEKIGGFKRYVDTMYHYMWAQPRKLDDPAVIRETLLATNFDADALLALSQTPEVKSALLANTQNSVDRGAFGSPSFFVGDEMYFGKDRLADVERAILEGAI